MFYYWSNKNFAKKLAIFSKYESLFATSIVDFNRAGLFRVEKSICVAIFNPVEKKFFTIKYKQNEINKSVPLVNMQAP